VSEDVDSAAVSQAAQVEIKPKVTSTMASKAVGTGKAGTGKGVGTGFTPSTAPAPAIKPTDRAQSQARLDALRARYEADAPHRQFVTAFNTIVFGDGDPCARLVFVGEAPGEEEDKTGKPFVGRAGQLLNKMIAAMGTTREEVYICNVLKTRPPNNATPSSFEANLCKPYLMEQLAILQPEVIVTLGLPATHTLLECTDSMARLRGKWATLRLANGLAVPVMPTYHPAFLLRSYNAENRGKVWADLADGGGEAGAYAFAQVPGLRADLPKADSTEGGSTERGSGV
jgi:uracil-DNA glycosylase family 4